MSLPSAAVAFLGFLLLLGALTGVALFFIAIRRQEVDARDTAYQAFCKLRGYRYVAARPGEEKQYVRMRALFNQGPNRLWQCEISGSLNGRPFTALEFTNLTRGGSKRISTFAIMRWERVGDQLPSFLLRPIDQFNGEAAGDEARVEFDEDPIFTFAYALVASDADAARAFFSAERRNAIRPLMQADPQQYVQASGPTLFWYRPEYLPPPERLDAFLAAGDRIAATLLDY